MPANRILLTQLFVAVAVVCAACGSGASPDNTALPSTSAPERLSDTLSETSTLEEGVSAESPQVETSDVAGEEGPSEKLPSSTPLSLVSVFAGGVQTQLASSIEIDGRAGDCMRSQGFSYSPLVSELTVFLEDYRTIGEWVDYATEYGYGFYYYETSAGREDSLALQEAFNEIGPPNRDFSAEYTLALLGPDGPSIDEVFVSAAFPVDRLGDGCLKQAITSFRADQGLPELSTATLALLQSLNLSTSSEFQEANAAWVECMADAGFEVELLGDTYVDVQRDYDAGVDRYPVEVAEERFETERAAAIADALCTWEHVLRTRLRLELGEIERLSEQNPELARFLPTANLILEP